jgi:hypothetical protein
VEAGGGARRHPIGDEGPCGSGSCLRRGFGRQVQPRFSRRSQGGFGEVGSSRQPAFAEGYGGHEMLIPQKNTTSLVRPTQMPDALCDHAWFAPKAFSLQPKHLGNHVL